MYHATWEESLNENRIKRRYAFLRESEVAYFCTEVADIDSPECKANFILKKASASVS